MSEVKPASPTKLAGGLDAEPEVNIEDFRGDSATDDIARKAVMKSLVDIEQKGATQDLLCCATARTLLSRKCRINGVAHTVVRGCASCCCFALVCVATGPCNLKLL